MTPIETTEFDLQFALDLSPWWLLLLVPLCAGGALLLYRRQIRGLTRVHAAGLLALRLFLVAALVVLAFRPSLIHRTLRRFPGRILFVLDDSASMETRDLTLSGPAALRLRRAYAASAEDQGRAYHRLAASCSEVEEALRTFERRARALGVRDDRFYELAATVQDTVLTRYDRMGEAIDAAPPAPDSAARDVRQARQLFSQLRQGLASLFAGDTAGEPAVFDQYCAGLNRLRAAWLTTQAALDTQALAGDNNLLRQAAAETRGTSRLQLGGAVLAAQAAALRARAGEQSCEVVCLDSGERRALAAFRSEALATTEAPTHLIDGLKALLEEESEYPLSGIFLLSDGRDLGETAPASLVQALVRQQVPLHTIALGTRTEPTDVAVLDLIAPPFAVTGLPIEVRVRLKTALPQAQSATIAIRAAGAVLASKTLAIGDGPEETVVLALTPDAPGHRRYTVTVDSLAGETFPVRNNSTQFVTHVRDEKVRVLLLDWKPRWETRFAINTFRRLDYIDCNAIVVLARPEARLQRGVERGAWPADLAALSMYDLIVLGDLPEDLLRPAEWEALEAVVRKKGKTLCLLGTAPPPGLPQALQATPLPAPVATRLYEAGSPRALRLTAPGAIHPLTRRLRTGVEGPIPPVLDDAYPDTQVLLTDAESATPLLAARCVDAGKVLNLRTAALWRLLNPTLLEAHNDLFVNLITWAIDGGFGTNAEANGPRLALDQRVFRTSAACQAWLYNSGETAVLAAREGDTVLAEAPVEPAYGESGLARAVFRALPAKDLVIGPPEGPPEAGLPIHVVEDNPELHRLARDADFLQTLARETGGTCVELPDLKQPLLTLKPKERQEKQETTWRLWDSRAILFLLALVLTAEWIWRKLVGLV